MNHALTEARSAEILNQLDRVADSVNGGESLQLALLDAEIYISEVLSDRKLYWFLFDNLNRQNAQLLWVWDLNFHHKGICPDGSELRF